MQAAILTVGDELLAGDVQNTNATWLAARLDERGVAVREIATVPDEVDVVAARVRRLADAHDVVVVTGGVGGTPDDVTMDAVARAFDCGLAVFPAVREAVVDHVAEVRERRPDLELDLDVDAWAAVPEAGRPLDNPEGLSPGVVVENVYVLPGIPEEMKAMFETVADEFAGDRRTRLLYAAGSESDLVEHLEAARESFDVRVGCYPTPGGGVKRVRVAAADDDSVAAAADWLRDRLADADAVRPATPPADDPARPENETEGGTDTGAEAEAEDGSQRRGE